MQKNDYIHLKSESHSSFPRVLGWDVGLAVAQVGGVGPDQRLGGPALVAHVEGLHLVVVGQAHGQQHQQG